MRRSNFYSISLVTMIMVSMVACDSHTSKESQLIGEWRAHWETSAQGHLPKIHSNNLSMNGLVKFMDNGQVEVSAYGYKGCIFSDDTLKEMLHWKLDDSVLRFIDSGNENGLPYEIRKFSNTEMQLTLLEDINLTLLRN